ncbi:MAG TPA: histidine kinase [Streptosporangiaceae bacterium]|nr:histidine kinase [Streptosporangiaceae bacterium]
MPLAKHQIGQPHSVLLAVVVALLVAGCLVAVLLRDRPGAKIQRGRLREPGWSAALVVLTALVAGTVVSLLVGSNFQWWWWLVIIAVATGLVSLLRALPNRIVAMVLMAYGLLGLELVRTRFGPVRSDWYGVAQVSDQPWGWSLVLLQAWAFLLAGGWLAWRELASRPLAARLVLGRMADPGRRGQLWGLLMLPAALAIGELVGSDAWLAVTVALLAVSILVIRKAPGIAARLATAELFALGTLGLIATHNWYLESVNTPQQIQRLYGIVSISTLDTRLAAWLEALALIGFGCWLVPQTFPEVRRLLGLAPDAQLVEAVERLTQSRAVAVDTAAADVRRLERDLHDGAQARLVALGMNLRAAEKLIHSSPDAAAALVAEAREASARALTELRELVRGVHPPVLADRGLADAVRALALDSPLNVRTDVDLPGRVPAPVETACYFSVAELLTNAAKHSGAREARVAISHCDGMLRIEVTDFGLGGADPGRGSGLAGIERRLATFDGILAISSPAGGPTIAVLEVPCALSSPKISSC